MTLTVFQDPEKQKWLKEQNAVATNFGYVNSKTGEQLTADRGLEGATEIKRPNSLAALIEAGISTVEAVSTQPVVVIGVGGEAVVEYEIASGGETKTIAEEITLNSDNNSVGYQFTLATFTASTPTESRAVAINYAQDSKFKFVLETTTTNNTTELPVNVVLKRSRSDGRDEVKLEDFPVTVIIGEQQFNVKVNLTIKANE